MRRIYHAARPFTLKVAQFAGLTVSRDWWYHRMYHSRATDDWTGMWGEGKSSSPHSATRQALTQMTHRMFPQVTKTTSRNKNAIGAMMSILALGLCIAFLGTNFDLASMIPGY